MQPEVRLKTSLNYSNWECWNSSPLCRTWGRAWAPQAQNIIHVFYYFHIYLYTLLRKWFWCQCDHTILKVTDPNGTSAKMIKKYLFKTDFRQRCHQVCLLQWYLLATSAVSVHQTALKLTGTSAQAEEFSVSVFFFSSYILWFTPLIELCTIYNYTISISLLSLTRRLT